MTENHFMNYAPPNAKLYLYYNKWAAYMQDI